MTGVRGALLGAIGLWAGAAHAATTVKASSEGTDREGGKHPAALVADGELQTAWVEGAERDGVGEWIELRFDKPVEVRTISLWGGDFRKGERSAKESGRPKFVTVTLETDAGPVTAEGTFPDIRERGIQRVDVEISGIAKSVRVTIDDVYAGFLGSDTYLAEIAVNFGEADGPGMAGLRTWMASPAGTKAADAHKTKVVGLFDTIDQSEFGDRDSLQMLMDYASNGAPWVQERARKDVPAGWRVQAIPPDEVAVEALLKLRDANAIPALTMAALRMGGKEQRALLSKVSYFEAWVELQGGPRRNLPTWGDEGWEKGALRGFGEPLAAALGGYGDLYVADVANHRVTVFGPDGVTRATWGLGKPNVTDTWFSGKRRHYVAGAEASTSDGGFTNPIDVAVLPGRSGEQIVVLDGLGKLQWFDEQGTVTRSVVVPGLRKLPTGIGGVGHLVVLKGKIAVVWDDEVVVVDLEGAELARFEIPEGSPIVAEALPGNKLLFGFRDEAVMYGADGFRHSTVLDSNSLPRGYEAYDLSFDEKKKLWAVTDNGWAVKFKRPGVVDWKVRWSDRSVDVPRFAVQDDMLFITADGRVVKVDALELKARAELADAPETGE